jgi:hypothetical protein
MTLDTECCYADCRVFLTLRQYFKDFSYNDFTFTINKCNITLMFLFNLLRSHFKIKSAISHNVIISNVTHIKCYNDNTYNTVWVTF